MGNFFMKPKKVEEQISRSPIPSKSSDSAMLIDGRDNKRVKFKSGEEAVLDKANNFNANGGNAVRIKIMMTKQELNQILSYEKQSEYSSIEKLLDAMNISSRRILDVKIGQDRENIGSGWKPELESIPEDH